MTRRHSCLELWGMFSKSEWACIFRVLSSTEELSISVGFWSCSECTRLVIHFTAAEFVGSYSWCSVELLVRSLLSAISWHWKENKENFSLSVWNHELTGSKTTGKYLLSRLPLHRLPDSSTSENTMQLYSILIDWSIHMYHFHTEICIENLWKTQ